MVKHSEYSIVNQLKKKPTRISLFLLIISFEPHHKALIKVLNKSYVIPDTSLNKVEHLVN